MIIPNPVSFPEPLLGQEADGSRAVSEVVSTLPQGQLVSTKGLLEEPLLFIRQSNACLLERGMLLPEPTPHVLFTKLRIHFSQMVDCSLSTNGKDNTYF